MTSKLATMATQEGESPIRGILGKLPIERDMDMVDAGEASGVPGTI